VEKWRLYSKQNPAHGNDLLPHAITISRVTRVKFRCPHWPVLICFRKIRLQCRQRGSVSWVPRVFFSVERRYRRLWPTNKTCYREQHIVGILWAAPSGRSAERIQLENQQRTDVRHSYFAGLLHAIKVTTMHRHDTATGQRTVYAGDDTGDHIIHNSRPGYRRWVFGKKIKV